MYIKFQVCVLLFSGDIDHWWFHYGIKRISTGGNFSLLVFHTSQSSRLQANRQKILGSIRVLTPPRIIFIIFGVPGTDGEKWISLYHRMHHPMLRQRLLLVQGERFPVFWKMDNAVQEHASSGAYKYGFIFPIRQCCSLFPTSIRTQQSHQAVRQVPSR